jgi:alpha-1,6-mannosyltransferase
VILEAFKQIPAPHSFYFLCVGDGPMKHELMQAIAGEPQIKMLPFEKNRKKLAEIFASADMYITAGPHETFGLCVLEAQSSGLPVIGVQAGALPERVPENVGLLGPVDSPSEMALNILILSKMNYLKLGRNARRLTEQNYAWDQIFAQLFQFYARHSAAHDQRRRMLSNILSFNNPRRKMHLSSRVNDYGNWKEKFTYRA